MTLKEHVIAWHGGRKKNAVKDFAKALKVQPPRVSLWFKGRNWPDEDIKPAICKLLKLTVEELDAMRPKRVFVAHAGTPDLEFLERLSHLENAVKHLTGVVEQALGLPPGHLRPDAGETASLVAEPAVKLRKRT